MPKIIYTNFQLFFSLFFIFYQFLFYFIYLFIYLFIARNYTRKIVYTKWFQL